MLIIGLLVGVEMLVKHYTKKGLQLSTQAISGHFMPTDETTFEWGFTGGHMVARDCVHTDTYHCCVF